MTRPVLQKVVEIQSLEARVMYALTPASPRPDTLGAVFDKTERLALLGRLTLLDSTTRVTLTSNLAANKIGAFDGNLLTYMRNRSNARFFWTSDNTASIASYTNSVNYASPAISEADKMTDTRQLADGFGYTTLPSNIDWIAPISTNNSSFEHTIGLHAIWLNLAQAYRYTNDTKYANELLYELADWSNDIQTGEPPASWTTADKNSWFFDTASRIENWTWTYFTMLDSSAWTGSANSLMLYKMVQQGDYMSSALLTRTDFDSNKYLSLARSTLYLGDLFPELDTASTWQTNGRNNLFKALGTQIHADGGHDEQSPSYASYVLQDALQAKKLDNLNGHTWPTTFTLSDGTSRNPTTLLTNGINALYQQLSPDGLVPAISDSTRANQYATFNMANYVLGPSSVPVAKPRPREVWLFGTSAVSANMSQPTLPALGTRGNTYSLPDSGYYMLRSGDDANARQINFDAGPKGGDHGHADLLSFELSGYGQPLIADAGPYKYDLSASRTWAISTKAHNTIGVIDTNHGSLEGVGNPSIKTTGITSVAGGYMISAAHQAYAFLAGSPTLGRCMWFDGNNTIVIVDFAYASRATNFEQSFLLPGQNSVRSLATGLIYTRNTGSNVNIQSLLRTAQTAHFQTTNIFTAGDGVETPPGTRYYVQQPASTFAVFATVINTSSGNAAGSSSTASWVTVPTQYGQSAVLNVNGTNITFSAPTFPTLDGLGTSRGTFNDIAYSPDGRLHSIFYNRDINKLEYAVRDTNGVWSTVQIVDNDAYSGYNPSMKIDSFGRPGVAYQDALNGDLKYAYLSPYTNTWEITRVDITGSTGGYPSLVFSRKNSPAIAYYNRTNGDLRLAQADTNGWVISTIESTGDVGRFASIQLDPNRPTATKYAIAYEDTTNGDVKYAIQYQATWRVETIDNTIVTPGGYNSLNFYDSGTTDFRYKPAASYYDASTGHLRFAYKTGGLEQTVWVSKTIAAGKRQGLYSKLYIDGTNKPRVLFFDGTRNKAMQATSSSITGVWSLIDLGAGGREIHGAVFNGKYTYSTLNEADGTLKILSI